MFPKRAHSAIICGATGCGKTEFVLDLLQTEYKGLFEYVIVICPTWMYNKAYLDRQWIFTDSEQVFLVDPLNWCPNSKDPMNDSIKFIYLFIYLFTHLAKNNKIKTKVRHYINEIL